MVAFIVGKVSYEDYLARLDKEIRKLLKGKSK